MLYFCCCRCGNGYYEFGDLKIDFLLRNKKKEEMEELVNKLPFHTIISGPTNCGKTQFLVDQLNGPFKKKI